MPELNDEFVKTVSKCSSVEEYREFVRKEAQRSLDNQARFEARDELMRKMMEDVEISVSKEVINAELDVMMAELSGSAHASGYRFRAVFGAHWKDERFYSRADADRRYIQGTAQPHA